MLTSEIIHLCHDQNGNPKVSVYPRFLRKKTVYYGRYKIDRTDLSNALGVHVMIYTKHDVLSQCN